MFQDQLAKSFQYSVQVENRNYFIVTHHKATQFHKVFWDGKAGNCGCKNFEFVGILCRHIFSVLVHEGCFEIPSTYWLSRWKREDVQFDVTVEPNSMDTSTLNNAESVHLSTDLVQCPPRSKTKGRPRITRARGGKELAKQVKRCSFCRCVGHNATTCEEKAALKDHNLVSQHALKKKKIDAGNEDLNPIFSTKC